jgi:hypothetical protein
MRFRNTTGWDIARAVVILLVGGGFALLLVKCGS